MAGTPFSLLISRAKWRKLRLLLKEVVLALRYRISELSPLNGAVMDQSLPHHGATTDGQSESHLTSLYPQKPVIQFTWDYHARVFVGAEILSKSALSYHQDKPLESGEVEVAHTYKLSEVCNATMCTNGATHVSIYGADGWCLTEFSYVKYGRNHPKIRHKRRHLPIKRRVSGLTVNLYGNVENTTGNYGHWMVDGAALLYLALREYSIEDIDHFLVPVLLYDFQRESLLAMGIPEQKLIELPTLSCFLFERLICASAPRGQSSCVTPGWVIDGYRKALLPVKPSKKHRRLYISRRDANSRKFVNEEEIVQLMERADFEIIELSQYGFVEKIQLFANADVVVGLTGAGLTNLMFCSKETQVIEIFPSSFVTYFYASMAAHIGLDYRALIFDNYSILSVLSKYYGNLSLDPHLLQKSLEDLH